MSHGLKLALADGQRWVIRPVDEDAAAIVAELGKVMRLGPAIGTGRPGEEGRELYVAVGSEFAEPDTVDPEGGGPVVCRLPASPDRDGRIVQMMQVASTIARDALARGGLLLHAALAEYHGSGFIMAGPGTVGKSTASGRLSSPWRSLCDDTTLVVRDDTGKSWAHPWPTWSRFWSDGPGGSWDVEQAVPLRAVFFLGQAPTDKLEPVNATQATAMTLESAVDLAREALRTDVNAARVLSSEGLSAAKAMALAVPAYTLKLSLTGRFWEEIERVLPRTGDGRRETEERGWRTEERGQEMGDRVPPPRVPARVPAEDLTVEPSRFADGSLRVVCTGTSMSPTLRESDLLEVEPYGTARVRRGDVVCFKSPEDGKMVVHRVVSVGGPGTGDGRPPDVRRETGDGRAKEDIRTRGDNNPTDDTGILQAGDILGRVEAVQRGGERRVIHGGWRGPVVLRRARLGRSIRRYAAPLPRTLYSLVAGLGFLDRLMPASLRPRLVRFDARYRVFLKLLSGKNAVGFYDDRCDEWHIRWPFRLFVKEQTLRKAVASSEETPG
jgi:signal peptidase I